MRMAEKEREFVFIAGTSGSGTTMLLRMLSSQSNAVSFGGNFINAGDSPVIGSLVKRLDSSTKVLWNTATSFEDWGRAREEAASLVEEARTTDELVDVDTFYFKRSCPFYRGDEHRPSFADALDYLRADKVIWIQRHPLDATFSSHQRDFCENLRHAANTQLMCLRHLINDFSGVDPGQRLFIRYEQFCADPIQTIHRLCSFLGHNSEPYKRWAERNPLKLSRRLDLEGTVEEKSFLADFWNRHRAEVDWLNEFETNFSSTRKVA